MKTMGKRLIGLAALLILLFSTTGAYAADVDVSAEGVYTSDEFDVCVFADINASPLISFGVKVGYDVFDLTLTSATKNEDDWYFGDSTTKYPYMDPNTDTPGQVIIIGGKLDKDNPTEGVDGLGVPLGRIKFDRTVPGGPFTTAVSLFYGRGNGTEEDTYKNFVANDGSVKDGSGVSFATVPIYQLGDADQNGVLTNGDIFYVRDMINAGEYNCAADCTRDGVLTNGDIFCVRDEVNNPS
jgi:hypothetical protein